MKNIFTINELTLIHEKSLELGFTDVKFIPAFNPDEMWQKKYREYLKKGYHASMKYLENIAPKFSIKKISESAETMAVFSLPYVYETQTFDQNIKLIQPDDNKLKYSVARFALGRDYHLVVKEKLEQIISIFGTGRIVCDTTPLAERYFGALAGMGFIGKNAMLIHPQSGSYFFLAFILFDRLLPADFNSGDLVKYNFEENMDQYCGSCEKCVKACPGGALDGSGLLNAQRCYSFCSIENRLDIIQAKFRKINSIFGCDICQEVCPYNAKPATTTDSNFKILEVSRNIMAGNLEGLSLKDTSYQRAGLKGLKRNLEYLQKK